ncbi:tRNA (guanine(10)-N2)-methyltransferase homolog isoform X1 [Apis cerana]|uniref:tRNA (guanine(10)-N(2))-methyltransferase TRMT11 n=1 Tax=Apis cerana cerana TaxID=94128 RepID=A0A2A3EHJ6_APICC|nr:tRNA (guanine(10)-N2)-methyltransferase homolog isoform X1 [Apis cerana]PBC30934.1 tRNA guanosine-2'-O-methyltransferase TRM11 [Apis cerana cerana]
MNNQWKKYLFWFAQEHIDFRKAEMESILNMFGMNMYIYPKLKEHPYWIINLPSENIANKISSRAVSVRFCMELWANSKTIEDLHSKLKNYPISEINKYAGPHKSFKIIVETFCKHFSQSEKVKKIDSFSYLPLEGPVRLNNPDTTLCYIEFYGLDPNNIPEKPYELFFGRWITSGQRNLIRKLSLKTRKFIGNTSMDPQLSLIMANQAQVQKGDIVLDPFVGTGSLLVAASHFGGYTLGTDIDFLMLHGRTRPSRISQKIRGKDENIATNMSQYGKRSYYIDVVVSDFSYPLWRSDMCIDAIITDPPYGIREATERIGTTKLNPIIEEHQASSHIPSKIGYDLPQMYKDLLTFAAKHLKLNGRLVCWFPLFRDQYSEDQLPTHPCLELIANSEQILSNYTSRRLLTYKKVKDPKESDEIISTNLIDFREKYFALRNESRREKRMKKAVEKAKKREIWEQNNKENPKR